MRRGLVVLGLAGCHGGIGEPFFDTFAFRDSFGGASECSDLILAEWPTVSAVGVDLAATPEVRVRDDVEGIVMQLQPYGVGALDGAPVVRRSNGWRLFSFLPDAPLRPLVSYVLVIGGEVDGCGPGAAVPFTTRGDASTTPPVGAWWLDGSAPSGVSADIVHRLFPRMGTGGYGLAPRLELDAAGAEVRVGTVSRAPGVPDNTADAPDVVAVTWSEGAFTSAAFDWTVEDATAPLVVRGAVLRGAGDAAGPGLIGVQLAGTFDLRGWPEAMRDDACVMADEQGIGCQDCGDGAISCLSLDARGMTGAPR